jgi:hypothetical protein
MPNPLILLLAVAVLGLILLRPALRLVIALVAGGDIGRRSLAKQPDEIHLVDGGPQSWRDPGAAEALGRPLLELGYEPAGTFTITEMPEVALRLLVHLREGVTAVIYEHPKAGMWAEMVCIHQDGSAFSVSSGLDRGLAQRPERPVVHLPGTAPAVLHLRLLALRPPKERVPLDAAEAPARFERAFADGMAWRKQQGISRAEVARIALTGVPKNRVKGGKAA